MSCVIQEDLKIEGHWRVNGTHYKRTSDGWLANMDANKEKLLPILAKIYGEVSLESRLDEIRGFLFGFRSPTEGLRHEVVAGPGLGVRCKREKSLVAESSWLALVARRR